MMETNVAVLFVISFCRFLSTTALYEKKFDILLGPCDIQSQFSTGNNDGKTKYNSDEGLMHAGIIDNKNKNMENTETTLPIFHQRERKTFDETISGRNANFSFDLQAAVDKGFRFQLEFCPMTCLGLSMETTPCFLSNPICDPCFCDAECYQYGDCCPKMCDFKSNHKTHLTRDRTSITFDKIPELHCFKYNAPEAIKIVASCPEQIMKDKHLQRFSAFHSQHNASKKEITSKARHTKDTDETRHQCDRCLFSADKIALVTSVDTNLTYCNNACLLCNEPSVEGTNKALIWRNDTTCKMQVNSNENAENLSSHSFGSDKLLHYSFLSKALRKIGRDQNTTTDFNDGGVTDNRIVNNITPPEDQSKFKTCRTNFVPPVSVSIRHCLDPKARREVKDCDLGALNTSLDKETGARLKSLCRDGYTWPVYTEGVWYKNVFCFLCQNQTPAPCKSKPVYRDGGSWTPITEFNLAMLTDITGEDDHRDDRADNDLKEENDVNHHSVRLDVKDLKRSGRLKRFQCPDGFWDSFLTNECVTVLCSEGRHLRTVTHEGISKFTCVLEEKREEENKMGKEEEEEVDDNDESTKRGKEFEERQSQGILYVVHVWWIPNEDFDEYEDGHDDTNIANFLNHSDQSYPSSESQDDINTHVTGTGKKIKYSREEGKNGVITFNNNNNINEKQSLDQLNSKTKSQYGNLTCQGRYKDRSYPDRVNNPDRKIHTRGNRLRKRHWGDRKSHNTVNATTNHRNVWNFNNAKRSPFADDEQSIERALINQTAIKMAGLNISDFLLIVSTRQTFGNANGRSHKISVYFILEELGNRNLLEKQAVKTFSETSKISFKGRLVSFQSALSNAPVRSEVVWQEMFYSCLDKVHICCSQLGIHEFGYRLREMRCSLSDSTKFLRLNIVTPCPFMSLNISSFNDTHDFKLDHKELPFSLKRQEFQLSTNGTILVCIDTLITIRKQLGGRYFRKIGFYWIAMCEDLLTVSCLPISMLCLLMTFVTYLVFPILRTKPAQNNMCLIFWLFVAQGTVLLNPLVPRGSVLCVLMGMALHYVWLSAMAWMCACSFHMFLVFVVRRAALGPYKSHRWYLFRYAFCCNVLPAVLVLVLGTIAHYSNNNERFGYGGWLCYMHPRLMVGLAFVLPQGIIIVVNATFFTITAVTISRIDDIKRQAGRERRNTHVYISLSSLTGLTWILAMVSLIPSLRFIRSVSVLFNGSQGVAIFLCFACNRRVRKLWRGLISPRGRGRRLTYTRSSSSRMATHTTNV